MNISLPEIISVGIFSSKLAAKNKAISKNRKTTMFEIDLPIENGGISYVDKEQKNIEPSFIICSKPGQTRHTKFPFKCYYIHMILKEGALYDMLMKMPDFIETDRHTEYCEIFKKMCKYCDTKLDDDLVMSQGLLLELVHMMNHDSKKFAMRENIGGSHYQMIENVVRYIKENLNSDLSLENVSRYAGLSAIHFHNCFKISTGETLREFVEEQRIKKAAGLLTTTNYTQTKIAYECGFSSQSYFSYAFKRKMGLTPREYSRKIFSQYEAK